MYLLNLTNEVFMQAGFFRKRADIFLLSMAVGAVFSAPVKNIYLTNKSAFILSTPAAAAISLAIMGAISAAVAGLLWVFRSSGYKAGVTSLVLAFALSVLLQFHFAEDYFRDYTTPETSIFDRILMFSTHFFLLAVPFFASWKLRKIVFANICRISLVLLFAQLAYAVLPLFDRNTRHEQYDYQEYYFSEQDKFTFGSKRNVILLVVDSMGADIARELLTKYPEVASGLADFTMFDKYTSDNPRTMYAVPAMLSGIPYAADEDDEDGHSKYLERVCRDKNSLFSGLKRHGFRVEGYPFILQTISYAPDVIDNSTTVSREVQKASFKKLLETSFSRMVMLPLRKLFGEKESLPFVVPTESRPGEPYDRVFYSNLVKEFKIGEKENVFKYLHLHGAHDPVVTGANLETPEKTPLRVEQLRGSFKVVLKLIELLKSHDLWSETSIIITGDHSELYTPGTVCFVKNSRSASHPLMVNHSPGKVDYLAGTILKEFEKDTHLPSLNTCAAAQEYQPEKRYTPVETATAWKKMTPSVPSAHESLNTNCYLDGNRLVFESYPDAVDAHCGYRIVVRSEENNQVWSSEYIFSTDQARYITSCEFPFPDGNYRVEIHGLGRNELHLEPHLQSASRRLWENFLRIKDGKAQAIKEHEIAAKRHLYAGKTIDFGVKSSFPMLKIREKAAFRQEHLLIFDGAVMELSLAASARAGVLRFAVIGQYYMGGVLTVSCGDNIRKQITIKAGVEQTVDIPLVANTTPEKLTLKFGYAAENISNAAPQRNPGVNLLRMERL